MERYFKPLTKAVLPAPAPAKHTSHDGPSPHFGGPAFHPPDQLLGSLLGWNVVNMCTIRVCNACFIFKVLLYTYIIIEFKSNVFYVFF